MRRTVRPLMALAMLSALSLPAATATPAAAATVPPAGVALLQNSAGTDSGFVLLQTEGDHIRVTVAASNLTPGFHGIHLHSVGKCDGPDFTSAGGHLAAPGQTHGGHSGDFPPLYVTADGTGAETFTTNHVTMDQVFDADGSAVIVHGGADNLANIPARYSSNAPGAPATGPDATTNGTGDSGARVLCGFMSTELVNLRGDNPKPTDGSVGGFGEAVPAGDAPAGAKPVVGIANAVGTDGYWLAATDGEVFTGRAPFL